VSIQKGRTSFLKKEAKNFCSLSGARRPARESGEKVFCFFSSEKKALP